MARAPRPFTPKVVTANDLLEGDVVYLTEDDQWTRRLSEAEIITDEAHAQLRLLHGERQPEVVVGVYLADVSQGDNGPEPTHFREDFRRTGPSNYPHGKQEVSAHV
ncbi:DUF2849 domain-containing protein [Chachezhania antarctica]|mgnify:CR=1 FL=1|uniref:DUF2849 domain-containing protein n=1 Tax=Chachezhania antarctica TaxID=2340860 RepID=UPI000EAF53AE|nr:DUF2849 domain-containing protein [Chachezhania antarctica]|tara:strand:- start:3367 stop:3684 length:318 start_codon:yes stop_codon:yes gene_type:complete